MHGPEQTFDLQSGYIMVGAMVYLLKTFVHQQVWESDASWEILVIKFY